MRDPACVCYTTVAVSTRPFFCLNKRPLVVVIVVIVVIRGVDTRHCLPRTSLRDRRFPDHGSDHENKERKRSRRNKKKTL